MLVTDAGAWVRALFDEGPQGSVRARLRREPYVDAPALIDLEFLSAARGLLARRLVTRGAAEESIERFLRAPSDRHAHGLLAGRAWCERQPTGGGYKERQVEGDGWGGRIPTWEWRIQRPVP